MVGDGIRSRSLIVSFGRRSKGKKYHEDSYHYIYMCQFCYIFFSLYLITWLPWGSPVADCLACTYNHGVGEDGARRGS